MIISAGNKRIDTRKKRQNITINENNKADAIVTAKVKIIENSNKTILESESEKLEEI